jgi:outer membrane biosynthesis protein TonB
MITTEREKKNNRIALATSVGIHVALFFLFLFAVAWRAPDPPLPEYGIQLNFGMDTQGSGDVQPEIPVGTESQEEQNQQLEEEQEEVVQEEVKPTESTPAEQQVTTKQESPVVVKEQKVEKKEVEKPKEKPEEKSQEKVVPKEEVKAAYKPADKKENIEGKAGNQGDDTNKTGDKGDPKGTLDAKALYGKQGGGSGGSRLDLDGWEWDEIPKPNVPNNESGRVVFEIKVNSVGEITGIKTIERSVSLEAENICRNEIQKLTFTKTGINVPKESTGRITFVVRSN